MSAEQVLYDTLKADPTVAGIVAQRIYKNVAPQKRVYPLITYQVISGVPTTSLDGDSNLDYVRIQVDCWDTVNSVCFSLKEAVRVALDPVSLIDSFRSDYEDITKLYREGQDFKFWQHN